MEKIDRSTPAQGQPSAEPRVEMTATIRPATSVDAMLVSELSAALFRQTYASSNAPEDMRAYLATAFGTDRQRAQLEDPNRRAWIAMATDARPIGYAILRLGTRAQGVDFQRPAEIERIYVDREWHGRGVGHALMNACVDEATSRSCDGIWLGVWRKNPRAIGFYRRNGFSVVGETTFTLGADVQLDDVMARSLVVTTPA